MKYRPPRTVKPNSVRPTADMVAATRGTPAIASCRRAGGRRRKARKGAPRAVRAVLPARVRPGAMATAGGAAIQSAGKPEDAAPRGGCLAAATRNTQVRRAGGYSRSVRRREAAAGEGPELRCQRRRARIVLTFPRHGRGQRGPRESRSSARPSSGSLVTLHDASHNAGGLLSRLAALGSGHGDRHRQPAIGHSTHS